MSAAVERLIAAVLQSDDPILRALARAEKRGRGRPKAKLPDASNKDFQFAVFCGLHDRRYTGEVSFVGGEPVAVSKPKRQSKHAIALELAPEFGVSAKTLEQLVAKTIGLIERTAERTAGKSAGTLLGQLQAASNSGKK